MKLMLSALVKYLCGVLLMGLLVFLPAGSLCYGYGWLLMGLLLGPMLLAGIVMHCKDPAFLEKRLDGKEKYSKQKVVDTGLYGIVRHPMYMATVLLFWMIPLVLGSWYALIVFALYPAIIVVRLKDEEKLLTRELPGYGEYKKKVKYRLIPFIW